MKQTIDGQRRWTAVLMTDMVGFSTISEEIGPENVYILLGQVIEIATACVERHGGHTIDYAGDSVLAAFGAPVALENASLNACRSALEFLQEIEQAGPRLHDQFGVRPTFRVGIGGGEVVFGNLGLNEKLDKSVIGPPVNQAARLEALAAAGEVLISGIIHQQSDGHVLAEDRGDVQLKGFHEPTRVFALKSIHDDAARFDAAKRRGLSGIVGRTDELEVLSSFIKGGTGEPGALRIEGTAGMGKSRLLHEALLQAGDHVTVHYGQCDPRTGSMPFAPFLEILRSFSGTAADATPETLAEELVAAGLPANSVDAVVPALGADHARAGDGNADEMDAALNLRAQLETLIAEIGGRPDTLIVIEDTHWIDSPSDQLIARLLNRADVGPLRLLCTARPEHQPNWAELDNCETLALTQLDEATVGTLVQSRMEGRAIAPSLLRLITERAEGVPFFAEEIARYLLSQDVLVETDEGFALSPDEQQTLLTGNVQHLLLSRVDALPDNQRKVLQYAAAAGRQISERLLSALFSPGLVQETISNCTESGLIEADPTGLDNKWRFAHALIGDAIYGSLLSNALPQVHLSIAEAMEADAARRNTSFSRDLAYHFSRAGVAGKAVIYLAESGRDSLSHYSLEDADDFLSKAFEFIDAEPDCVSDEFYCQIVIDTARVLDIMGDFIRSIRLADDRLERMQQAGRERDEALFNTLYVLALAHLRRYREAQSLCERTMAWAIASGEELIAAWAKTALLRILSETEEGAPETVDGYFDDVMPVAEAHDDQHLSSHAIYLLSAYYRARGKVERARGLIRRLEEMSETHGNRRARSYACWANGLLATSIGESNRALEFAEEGLAHCLPGTADHRVNMLVWCNAKAQAKRSDGAMEQLKKLIDGAQKHGDYNIWHTSEISVCLLKLKSGKIHEGWRHLTDLIVQTAEAGNLLLLRQTLLLRAEFLCQIGGLLPTARRDGAPRVKRPKLAMKDRFAAFRIRWGVKRKIRADLNKIIDLIPHCDGAGYARAMVLQAMLNMAEGAETAASAALATAKKIAVAEDLPNLLARIEMIKAAQIAHYK